MCDYSLELVASRPAKVGDKLISTGSYSGLGPGAADGGGAAVVKRTWLIGFRSSEIRARNFLNHGKVPGRWRSCCR